MEISVKVVWPSAPLTLSLVHNALNAIDLQITDSSSKFFLQWSTYDSLDHERAYFNRSTALSSSYTFRKSLIRKHFLSRAIYAYLKKNPDSLLSNAAPRTYEIELSFADELDEMWTDELWDLGAELDNHSWWILKPGMADRGMGIRIFNSKEDLHHIFENFESQDADEENGSEGEDASGTAVVTSQLRHFVIQEYILNPLLLDPSEFHLRVYCVAVGALKVYAYNRILALFSAVPYKPPQAVPSAEGNHSSVDLAPHLTNTSLQVNGGEQSEGEPLLTTANFEDIVQNVGKVLAETFKAALGNPVHFQPVPNAFELYGVDFLVSHTPFKTLSPFQVKILEINAEPAIELTGVRLTWILEDLFVAIGKVCVEPFFREDKVDDEWRVGDVRHNFVKCLDEEVRK
ncbi:hypothetical protein K443DRAFT_88429 [Laccaria amethystina LaAM-08-1]|uniref:Tubulin-tyrosine ligase n=1 Tax=Laccaria amethystina LaAM-08-1 TaxID=1095629 RepID=A0A0C9YFI3_9AGAR|nr:hypothetical protein K443DRAFT_88429 [Laccaria amethystina LaAM-08-1]